MWARTLCPLWKWYVWTQRSFCRCCSLAFTPTWLTADEVSPKEQKKRGHIRAAGLHCYCWCCCTASADVRVRLRVSVKTLSRWRRTFIKRRILRQLSVWRRTLALIEHQHSLRGIGSAARVLYFHIYIPINSRGRRSASAEWLSGSIAQPRPLTTPPSLLPRVFKCAGLCWSEEKRDERRRRETAVELKQFWWIFFFFTCLSSHIQYEAVDTLD